MVGGILANRNSANHAYCFLSNQKKVQILAFLHVIQQRNVSCPLPMRHKGIIGRGNDLRLEEGEMWFHNDYPSILTRTLQLYI